MSQAELIEEARQLEKWWHAHPVRNRMADVQNAFYLRQPLPSMEIINALLYGGDRDVALRNGQTIGQAAREIVAITVRDPGTDPEEIAEDILRPLREALIELIEMAEPTGPRLSDQDKTDLQRHSTFLKAVSGSDIDPAPGLTGAALRDMVKRNKLSAKKGGVRPLALEDAYQRQDQELDLRQKQHIRPLLRLLGLVT
jgi:hypothetical protein